MKKRVTVSDVISLSEIEKWTKGDIVIIQARTGDGKSYFSKNILFEHAKANNKRILFLVNRSNCYNQFLDEIIQEKKNDFLDIKTYQKLEYDGLNKQVGCNLTKYDYIICDEFHYFLNDSTFNDKTDVSFDQIMQNNNSVKIFMSATGQNMGRYIKENIKLYINPESIKVINYNLPIKFDFVKKLSFFYEEETFDELIEEFINQKTKAIFFIQNLEEAYELYKRHRKHCLFNCGKTNKKFYRHVKKEKISKMLKDEMFEELILITTTCMDSGVNIKDVNLKNIVVHIYDFETLIQCIGRKRLLDSDDGINLYVKYPDYRKFGGIKIENDNSIERINYLKTHTAKEYIKEYPRSAGFDRAIYDLYIEDKDSITKKINPLIEFKCRLVQEEIKQINLQDKSGYRKYLLKKLGIHNYELYEYKKRKIRVYKYLNEIKGKTLNKQEQEKLTDIFNIKDSSRRKYKTIGKFNKYLLENNFEYEIIRKIIKNKTYWMIVKREVLL